MSRVFVIQNQHKLSSTGDALEPKFDLRKARKFGELVDLLSPTARPFNPDHCIGVLREKLADYHVNDYLLLIGNPALIGFAVSVAAELSPTGRVRLLQWDGKRKEYIPIEAQLRNV